MDVSMRDTGHVSTPLGVPVEHGGRSSAYVVSICLLVAIAQLSCSQFSTLSPWKGGGFGMFASSDSPWNRFISLTGEDYAGNIFRIDLPRTRFTYPRPLTADYLARVTIFPQKRSLEAVAAAVLSAHVVRVDRDEPLSPRLQYSAYRQHVVGGSSPSPQARSARAAASGNLVRPASSSACCGISRLPGTRSPAGQAPAGWPHSCGYGGVTVTSL